jgi:hypothetical protein
MKRWGHALIVVLAVVLGTAAMPAAAEEPPPSVQILTNKSVYVAGQTATLNFAISNAGEQTHLKVVAVYANHTSKVLNDTDVYTDDVPSEQAYMYYDTRIDVYLGGATEPTASRKLPVRAAIGSAISGYFTRSGSWAVFAKGTEPVFRSATTPARYMRCIKHEVWRHYSSGWKVILLTPCKWESSTGQVTWRWTGTHPSGVYFRVRAKFPGDGLNHPNSGKFIYFRFR